MPTMSQDTLEKLVHAKNYNRWIYKLCRLHIGEKLLEVGCGTGNMTKEFVMSKARVMATDIDEERIADIKKTLGVKHDLQTAVWDVTRSPDEIVRSYQPDTIACINMLEHINDDVTTLKRFCELLGQKGKIIVYVPALKFLYGTLDKELFHYRRYSKKEIIEKMEQAGFVKISSRYVNWPGIFGWWLNSRLLKRKHFSLKQILLYDAMIPFISAIDFLGRKIAGQSLMIIAEKTEVSEDKKQGC